MFLPPTFIFLSTEAPDYRTGQSCIEGEERIKVILQRSEQVLRMSCNNQLRFSRSIDNHPSHYTDHVRVHSKFGFFKTDERRRVRLKQDGRQREKPQCTVRQPLRR